MFARLQITSIKTRVDQDQRFFRSRFSPNKVGCWEIADVYTSSSVYYPFHSQFPKCHWEDPFFQAEGENYEECWVLSDQTGSALVARFLHDLSVWMHPLPDSYLSVSQPSNIHFWHFFVQSIYLTHNSKTKAFLNTHRRRTAFWSSDFHPTKQAGDLWFPWQLLGHEPIGNGSRP